MVLMFSSNTLMTLLHHGIEPFIDKAFYLVDKKLEKMILYTPPDIFRICMVTIGIYPYRLHLLISNLCEMFARKLSNWSCSV